MSTENASPSATPPDATAATPQDATAVERKAPLGKRLKQTFEEHAFFVVLGLLITGFTFATALYKMFPTETPKADVDLAAHERLLPIDFARHSGKLNITVFGYLTGEHQKFGLSHARGVMAGILHAYTTFHNQDPTVAADSTHFEFKDEAPLQDDHDRLYNAFEEAMRTSDVIFGPMSSQNAVYLFAERKVLLTKPVILTTASSMRVREHPQYGTMLFQLSASIDEYSRQLVTYVAHYSPTKIRSILCLYAANAYGRSANDRITFHATFEGLQIRSKELPAMTSDHTFDDSVTNLLRRLRAEFAGSPESEIAVFVVVYGTALEAVAKIVRREYPNASFATTTSLEREQIASGNFDGALVLYSYAPVMFSVATLEFLRFTEFAQARLGDLKNDGWHLVDTIDAEAHDAAMIWFSSARPVRGVPFADVPVQRELVTRASVGGKGTAFGNAAQLFLFRTEKGKMEPVALADH